MSPVFFLIILIVGIPVVLVGLWEMPLFVALLAVLIAGYEALSQRFL